jgi:predicted transcriptional regulator
VLERLEETDRWERERETGREFFLEKEKREKLCVWYVKETNFLAYNKS